MKENLSSSVRKRVSFIDKKGTLWKTICKYLLFTEKDVEISPFNEDKDAIAWYLYLLSLAVKKGAEVPILPNAPLYFISRLIKSQKLSKESLARLPIIEGLFRSFSQHTESPTLTFSPRIPITAIRDRIDEIVEDAYMLEASRLRRFFGYRQNITSIKRDLRLVLKTITQNSKWAKGVVNIGTDILSTSQNIGGLSKLHEIIPGISKVTGPILSPQIHTLGINNARLLHFRPSTIGSVSMFWNLE